MQSLDLRRATDCAVEPGPYKETRTNMEFCIMAAADFFFFRENMTTFHVNRLTTNSHKLSSLVPEK